MTPAIDPDFKVYDFGCARTGEGRGKVGLRLHAGKAEARRDGMAERPDEAFEQRAVERCQLARRPIARQAATAASCFNQGICELWRQDQHRIHFPLADRKAGNRRPLPGHVSGETGVEVAFAHRTGCSGGAQTASLAQAQ